MRANLQNARRPVPLVMLPEGETILDNADACEEAAMEILAHSSERWGTDELREWLSGPYRVASRHSGPANRRPTEAVRTDAEVRELLRTTRAFIELELETARARANGLDDAFAILIERGLVVRACDATGQGGFLPASEARMTLIDRVMSLLAAHYLTQPRPHHTSGVASVEPVSGIRLKYQSQGPSTLLGIEPAKHPTLMGLGISEGSSPKRRSFVPAHRFSSSSLIAALVEHRSK